MSCSTCRCLAIWRSEAPAWSCKVTIAAVDMSQSESAKSNAADQGPRKHSFSFPLLNGGNEGNSPHSFGIHSHSPHSVPAIPLGGIITKYASNQLISNSLSLSNLKIFRLRRAQTTMWCVLCMNDNQFLLGSDSHPFPPFV